MNTKHSPAPWHSERHQRFMPHEVGGPGGSYEGVNTWFNLIVSEDQNDPRLRTPIAEITVSTESDANGRLIAAAPELLEACLEIVKTAVVQKDESGECVGVLVTHEAFSWAMDAIAKATGEPQ